MRISHSFIQKFLKGLLLGGRVGVGWPWPSPKRRGSFLTSDILNHVQTWQISKAEQKRSSQVLSEHSYLIRLVCIILAMGTGLYITGEWPRALTGKLGHLWGCLWNLELGSVLPLPPSLPPFVSISVSSCPLSILSSRQYVITSPLC